MTSEDPYFIDFPGRIRTIQSAMADEGIDIYLGSRLRTLSWTLDAFAPWRSFVVIPADGLPTTFTFVIDAARLEDERGFADFMIPGFEHGIGLMGDERRIGLNDGPFPYWTNPEHVYLEGELIICAMQYACPEESIGFRYENPIVLHEDRCEPLSKFPLRIDEVH